MGEETLTENLAAHRGMRVQIKFRGGDSAEGLLVKKSGSWALIVANRWNDQHKTFTDSEVAELTHLSWS